MSRATRGLGRGSPRGPDVATRDRPLVIDALTGGWNPTDPPAALDPRQVVTADNVDWQHATLARKRDGMAVRPGQVVAPCSQIGRLIRHTPTADPLDTETWLLAGDTSVCQRARYEQDWTAITFSALTSAVDADAASFNGKLFLATQRASDRLAVFDGATLRSAGVGTPAAPTVANTGSGSYAATIRYYKVAYIEKSGSTIIRRSELSPAVSFTPSGSGTAARVTKPAALSEGETHWELYGSADASSYFRLAETAVGTTTVDDATAPSAYTGDAPPVAGWNTVPGAAKYLLVDENRLLMAGSWVTTAKQSRVEFTPVIGASDIGDDERVPNTTLLKYWIDLDPMDDGGITGMGGPVNGNPFVFKRHQTWKLVRTGVLNSPYLPLPLSKEIGCVANPSIVLAEDETGAPALYWWAEQGPYRFSGQGFQSLALDIEAIVDTVNLAATIPVHALWVPTYRQIWWWVATGAALTPDTLLVFDVRKAAATGMGVRGGWSRFTGELAAQRASVLWPVWAGFAAETIRLAPLHYWRFTTSATVGTPSVGTLALTLAAEGAWAPGTATEDSAEGSLYRDSTVSADPAATASGINTTLDGTESITIACWVAKGSGSALTTAKMLVRTGAGTDAKAGVRLDSDFTTASSLRLTVGNGSARESILAASQLAADAGWYHYVGVIDRGASPFLRLYTNGAQVASAALVLTGDFTSTDNLLEVLALDQCNLDELTIWNRALSATEIAALYAEQSTAKAIAATVPHHAGAVVRAEPKLTRSLAGSVDVTPAGVDSPYQGVITTKPLPLAAPMQSGGITEVQLHAKAAAGVSVDVTLTADYGLETRAAAVSLAPAASETRVLRKVEDVEITAAQVVQITLGDAEAVESAWTLDALHLQTRAEELR